jgi:hypothetical protein
MIEAYFLRAVDRVVLERAPLGEIHGRDPAHARERLGARARSGGPQPAAAPGEAYLLALRFSRLINPKTRKILNFSENSAELPCVFPGSSVGRADGCFPSGRWFESIPGEPNFP